MMRDMQAVSLNRARGGAIWCGVCLGLGLILGGGCGKAVPPAPTHATIHEAAASGDSADVQRHLDAGARVDGVDLQGNSPLMAAAENGHLEVVRLLVANWASVNAQSDVGYTPLNFAAGGGHLDVVRYLLDHGADVNARGAVGYSPLIFAAENGHRDVVEYLVSRGADLGVRGAVGYTPLIFAAAAGHLGVVEYLVEQGADVNAKGDDGYSALMWAVSDGSTDVADYLRSHGATGEVHITQMKKNVTAPMKKAGETPAPVQAQEPGASAGR